MHQSKRISYGAGEVFDIETEIGHLVQMEREISKCRRAGTMLKRILFLAKVHSDKASFVR
jgi:hypothetical protein